MDSINRGKVGSNLRDEASRRFKQAKNISSPFSMTKSSRSSSASADESSKAAAWAWYQRHGGSSTSSEGEATRRKSSCSHDGRPSVVVRRRSSRFKAEARQASKGASAAAPEKVASGGTRSWDPSRSLFDSYELQCVVKELDKALKQQQTPRPSATGRVLSTSASLNSVSSSDSSTSSRMKRSLRKILCNSQPEVVSAALARSKSDLLLSKVHPSSSSSVLLPRKKLSNLPSELHDDHGGRSRSNSEYHQHFHHHRRHVGVV